MTTKKIDPKVDPKIDPKVDPKVDPEPDPKVDPKIDPQPDPKVDPIEPDDAKVRSELGRKVKALGEGYEDLNAKLDMLLAQTKPVEVPVDDGFDEDWVPTTKQELDDYFDKKITARDIARTSAEKSYSDAYLGTVGAFRDHENYDEICAELSKNFNVRHTNDGRMDAKMNFLEAANAHYRKKIHGKANPLDKNKGEKLPLGSGGDDEIVDKDETVMPQLDKDAMAYIEATGKTAEQVIEILKKPLPLGIGSIGDYKE